MKKISLVLCLLLVLTCPALAAQVRATGNVNVRTGPGLDYGTIETVFEGNSLEYTGQTEYDDRGVAWYSVDCYGQAGWMSSKYSELEGEVAPQEDYSSGSNESAKATSSSEIELSGYLGADINTAGKELGLHFTAYEEGEWNCTYSNDYVTLGSYDGKTIGTIEIHDDILLNGDSCSYSLFGMNIWDPRFEAEEKLSQYGYSMSEGDPESGFYTSRNNDSEVWVSYESNRLQTITGISYYYV